MCTDAHSTQSVVNEILLILDEFIVDQWRGRLITSENKRGEWLNCYSLKVCISVWIMTMTILIENMQTTLSWLICEVTSMSMTHWRSIRLSNAGAIGNNIRLTLTLRWNIKQWSEQDLNNFKTDLLVIRVMRERQQSRNMAVLKLKTWKFPFKLHMSLWRIRKPN